MATLVLSAVGTLVAGPLGGALGSLVGARVDSHLLGTGAGSREGPRLSDLSVQSSDYGAPLPLHYGTMRSAGTLIWSTGLKETAHRSGGGKKSGGRTTTYSYSASFAIAFAGREIDGVGRIWADGKLLRGAAGDMRAGGGVRIYKGDQRQQADPLLQAELGMDGAPAHRGTAYAVFEDLELADFANRIPNLSFEVFAGTGDAAVIASDLGQACGVAIAAREVEGRAGGFSVSRNNSLADILAALSVIAPFALLPGSKGLLLEGGQAEPSATWTSADMIAGNETKERRRDSRRGAEALPRTLTVTAADPARDYQPTVQRSFRAGGTENASARNVELPAALSASEAKQVAEAYHERLWRSRRRIDVRLPISYLALTPGDRVVIEDGGEWAVKRTAFTGFTAEFSLEEARGHPFSLPSADGGAAQIEIDVPQGETELRIAELLPLGTEPDGTLRIYVAAGGASPGWRYAEIWTSMDTGETWRSAGVASTPAKMGKVVNAPAPADTSRWDLKTHIYVDLIDDQALENASRDAVLAGANLALAGREVLQFCRAEEIAPRRWRLSRLLRGRRGTEAEVSGHAAGSDFLLLEPEALMPLDFPIGTLGMGLQVKAAGPSDSLPALAAANIQIAGRSLLPFSPVHLRAARGVGGAVLLSWVRRSRTGFSWLDNVDAPLAEEAEAYLVEIRTAGHTAVFNVSEPQLSLPAALQIGEFGGPLNSGSFTVRQLSQRVGAGTPRTASFMFH